VIYARRASALHAARPLVATAWCAALSAAALVIDQPLMLAALLAAVVGAAALAGVVDRLLWRPALSIFVLWVLVEALVTRGGLTVIARLGELPPFGRIDVTLEAVVYGCTVGLRLVVVILAVGLYAAAVDPDELLRLFRGRGMRSALTVTVATRMAGVLERDARRLADGARCRGNGRPARLAVVRAVTGGALDRALDVSSALELRGYGLPAVRARRSAPWSRHDLAFAASALAVLALLAVGEATGASSFDWDPRLGGPPVLQPALLSLAFVVVALLPFAQRRGIAR
jgi:energy-coupling factor transport system permease protein